MHRLEFCDPNDFTQRCCDRRSCDHASDPGTGHADRLAADTDADRRFTDSSASSSDPGPPAATRINFLADATAGVVTGTIQPGQSLYYVLNAAQGQPMIVMVDLFNHDVTMTIKTAGGTSLLNNGQNLNALLPVSEDYYITVMGGASSENFTLTVEIPARISFALGKNNSIISGKTAGGYIVSYVIFAQQGQNMEVDLNGVGKGAALTVWGFSDGQPYIRSVTGATTFSMKLPISQDYIIDIVPNAGTEVGYTIVVTVK